LGRALKVKKEKKKKKKKKEEQEVEEDEPEHVDRVDGLEKSMKTMLILSHLHLSPNSEQTISYTIIEPHLPMDRSCRITSLFEFAFSKRTIIGPVV
jgi:hypothetical protein